MIGIDTNVLLRWLIAPDEWDIGSNKNEIDIVDKTLRAKGAEFFVNPIVVAETTWILEQKLKLDRAEVCEVIDRLLYSTISGWVRRMRSMTRDKPMDIPTSDLPTASFQGSTAELDAPIR